MHNDTWYEVKTHWGWFRLDEGAYMDYLAGKLWITWKPGECSQQPQGPAEHVSAAVSEEALRLRDIAAKYGVYNTLQQLLPGGEVEIPYKRRMSEQPIGEMNLSVRSQNGLMRAGASTFGKLHALMESERGLRGVRNLGEKSEKEIGAAFLSVCYQQLNAGEKAVFWQNCVDEGVLRDRS